MEGRETVKVRCVDGDCYVNVVEGVVYRANPHPDNPQRYQIWVGDTALIHPYHPGDFEILNEVPEPTVAQPKTTLPVDSASRKEYPLFEGVLKYAPAALAGVARVSKLGNDKHNPGQDLHHSRGKSMDHGDCILRHMVDMSEDFGMGVGRDEKGVPQVDMIAWRALMLAQEWHEKHDGAPMAPNARESK